jgi:hypothetical protein
MIDPLPGLHLDEKVNLSPRNLPGRTGLPRMQGVPGSIDPVRIGALGCE